MPNLLRPRNIALALLGLGIISYSVERLGGKSPRESADQDQAVVPVMEGFENHRDSAGFTVQRPDGWQISAPSLSEITVSSPDGGSAALIRARVARGDLARWLSQSYPGTERWMREVKVLNATAEGPNVAHATLRLRHGKTDKTASVVAVRQGDVATVFAGVAPTEQFAAELPKLTQILESFRFTPQNSTKPAAAASRPKMRFVQWVDPNEQAFSFQIPAGWRPQGGLLRRADGVRVVWQVSAPDQAAFFFAGDQSLPAYFVFPTEVALSLGNREGYPTGPGGPIMLRFQDAAAMGRNLIQQRFGQVQVVGMRERPDMIESVRRSPVLQGAVPRMSAAEIEFRMADGRIGMLALTTQGQEMSNLGGTWYVDNIHGFVAPPERASETAAALAQAVVTSRENPNWRSGEAAHQARMTAQYQEYHAWSTKLQSQAIEARWASDEAHQAGMRDILGGTVRLKDPQTGETFETGGQSRYYYRIVNSSPNAGIGTETDFDPMPEVDMRRLLRVGVEVPE